MPGDDGLLSQFYDLPGADEAQPQPQPNIQLLTVWNDSTYLAKHPAGCSRLEHVILINDVNLIFKPGEPSSLTRVVLERYLRTAYNTPQQPDEDIIRLYKNCPEKILPDLREHLSKLDQYMDRTLDEDE
ncbi:hypothetical protein TrVFT333_000059 [Trichoderma virens FT-333]|nr:hypothetical protein TrVFT333_000059 [Trichoderma virens FT-333]